MSRIIAYIILAFTILCASAMRAESLAATPRQEMGELGHLSNDELIDTAVKSIQSGSVGDRAMAALSVVVNRYYDSPNDTAVRRYATEAMRHLANIYMSYDIDYRKAYRYLKTARQIAEEDGNDHSLALLYVSLVNLYHMNDNKEADFEDRVRGLVKDGIIIAMKSRNDVALTCLTVDMAIIHEDTDGWNDYSDLAQSVKRYSFSDYGKSNGYERITRNVLLGFDAYFSENYQKSEKAFLDIIENLSSIPYGERFFFPVNGFLMRLYRKSGDIRKETELGKKLLALATEKGYTDYELWIYDMLSELYDIHGMNDSSEYYHNRYLRLQEQMKDDSGYESIQTLDFLSEIDRINKEVEDLSLKRQEQKRIHTVIMAALIILIIVIAALLWGYIALKRNHRNLYLKNEDMMRREEQHRLLREQWAAEKAELTSCPVPSANPTDNSASESSEDGNGDNAGAAEEDSESEKRELTALYTSILECMETSREIYRPGFQLSDLADMLGKQPRTVSRAINTCHGSNFHQLLNEYRIREASRRMHQMDSDNLTVEYIAESVGFKSRTSFATLFKKTIGLTPSEYWKMAKKGSGAK